MTLKQFLELSTAQQSRVKNDDLMKICQDNDIPYETDNNKSTLIKNINDNKPEEEEEAPAAEEENTENNGGEEENEEAPSEEEAPPEEEEAPPEEEEAPPGEEPPAEEPPAEEEEAPPDEPTAEEEAADAEVEEEKGGGQEVTSENQPPEIEQDKEHEALVRRLMGGFFTGDVVNYQCHGNLYPHTKGVKVAYADEATLIIELPEHGNLSHTFRQDLQQHLNVDKKYINAMPTELTAVSDE